MPDAQRPYKTPFYPLPQVFGIVAMTYLIFNNSPSPEMTKTVYMLTGFVLLVVALMSVIWVKFVMKKPLFSGFIKSGKSLHVQTHVPS